MQRALLERSRCCGAPILALSAPRDGKLAGMMGYTLRYAEELRSSAEYFSDIKQPADALRRSVSTPGEKRPVAREQGEKRARHGIKLVESASGSAHARTKSA
jgi:hypothetical protein